MAPRVLVTGASGYIGGRLVPELLRAGATVRAAGRDPGTLGARRWGEEVEVAEVDLLDRRTVRDALEGVDVVVFLVHAMGGGRGYAERESRMARIMADEASRAGVERIVYLSGLHPDLPEDELSEHMASRERVGRILSEGPVPALVLQAATIIGGGSASFEIIRHLADRLPLMPAPRWVANRIEPLAVRDVLHYLVAGVLAEEPIDGAFAVGSGERDLRFADLLSICAEVTGLARRTVIPLPVPAPLLSGLWIALVTPVPLSIALPLAQSMQHEAISHGRTIGEVLDPPPGGPTPYREAVRAAVAPYQEAALADLEDPERAAARGPAFEQPSDPDWAGPRRRTLEETRPRAGGALGELQRLLAEGSLHLTTLAGSSARWVVEPEAPGGGLAAHIDDRREGRVWLAGEATDDGGLRLRVVGIPRGITGFCTWWSRRPRRAAALGRLADALDPAGGSADPATAAST